MDQIIQKLKTTKLLNLRDFTGGDYIALWSENTPMSGVMNGIALHSNLIPYGGTFNIFLIIANLRSDCLP